MSIILVTGGVGFIGSHTCIELLNAGHEAIVLDNLRNSSPKSLEVVKDVTGRAVTFYQADIRDGEALEAVFENHQIDAVIHFAGLKAVGESSVIPLDYYDNNISGTVNLLKVMKNHDCKISFFLRQQRFMVIRIRFRFKKIFLYR